MDHLVAFIATFIGLAILWVVVLVLYNLLFEPFDFGALGSFALKSAILIGVVALITVIPYGRWFTLIVWWIGLVVIFKKDFWECRILVILIWGVSFGLGMLLRGLTLGG